MIAFRLSRGLPVRGHDGTSLCACAAPTERRLTGGGQSARPKLPWPGRLAQSDDRRVALRRSFPVQPMPRTEYVATRPVAPASTMGGLTDQPGPGQLHRPPGAAGVGHLGAVSAVWPAQRRPPCRVGARCRAGRWSEPPKADARATIHAATCTPRGKVRRQKVRCARQRASHAARSGVKGAPSRGKVLPTRQTAVHSARQRAAHAASCGPLRGARGSRPSAPQRDDL
jgi:hypothetical protein